MPLPEVTVCTNSALNTSTLAKRIC
ncbi:hypothetical protein HAINFHK1212_1137, partial [Haemophilus influenzae HK1212]